MKKLILPLMILLCSFFGTAQDTYFVLEGRSSVISTVEHLAQTLNGTNYPIYVYGNERLGNVFNYSLIHKGRTIASEKIHLSGGIILNVQRHLANPQAGESLMSVCGTQGGQFLAVNRKALELFQQEMEELANQGYKDPDPLVNEGFTRIGGLDGPGTTYVSPGLLKYDFTDTPNFNTQVEYKEKTWMGKNWWWVLLSSLAVAGGTYLVLENSSSSSSATLPDEQWGPQTNSVVLFRW